MTKLRSLACKLELDQSERKPPQAHARHAYMAKQSRKTIQVFNLRSLPPSFGQGLRLESGLELVGLIGLGYLKFLCRILLTVRSRGSFVPPYRPVSDFSYNQTKLPTLHEQHGVRERLPGIFLYLCS